MTQRLEIATETEHSLQVSIRELGEKNDRCQSLLTEMRRGSILADNELVYKEKAGKLEQRLEKCKNAYQTLLTKYKTVKETQRVTGASEKDKNIENLNLLKQIGSLEEVQAELKRSVESCGVDLKKCQRENKRLRTENDEMKEARRLAENGRSTCESSRQQDLTRIAELQRISEQKDNDLVLARGRATTLRTRVDELSPMELENRHLREELARTRHTASVLETRLNAILEQEKSRGWFS